MEPLAAKIPLDSIKKNLSTGSEEMYVVGTTEEGSASNNLQIDLGLSKNTKRENTSRSHVMTPIYVWISGKCDLESDYHDSFAIGSV